MSDTPFMNPPVKNPELDMVPGMAAPLPLAGAAPVPLTSADTSLSLGVALQVPFRWDYDFDALGNAVASYPGQGVPGTPNRVTVTPGAGVATTATIATTGTGGLALVTNIVRIGAAPQNFISITPGGNTLAAATVTMAGTGPLQFQLDNMLIGRGGTFNRLSIVPGATAATVITLTPSGTAGVQINATMGFNSTPPVAKPTVSGSRGANAALASLLTALAATGLLTDGSTA
jgi:hypothetical protein